MTIKSVGVVGAGTMGHGIAMHFALNGIPTTLCDLSESALSDAKMKINRNIKLFKEEGYYFKIASNQIDDYLKYTTNIDDLSNTDFITECVSEELEIKQDVFEKLDRICKKEAIITSNTSSLKISDVLVKVKNHRENCMLTHWFNPPHIVPLVELLKDKDTSEETFATIKKFLESSGKVTIKVKKESHGLVANRIQVAMAREVLALLEEDIADPKDLDLAITEGPGSRLSISGLLEIIDFGGIDVWNKVFEELLPAISSTKKTSSTIIDKVKKGDYGVKTGKGFYEYPNKSFDSYILERDKNLLKHIMNLDKLDKEKNEE